MSNQELCVYTIDIDGTLIGDITHHVAEWEILSRYDKKKVKQFKTNLIQALQKGLMRPHVAEFINHIKANNERAEFYLYTASEDKWAQFLVPCIEAACGCKFARPIFSRKHCLLVDRSLKKSLQCISTSIFNKLKARYSIKKASYVYDNMILIDNNKVLIEKEVRKGILCPSYDYPHSYDVLRLIDPSILEHQINGITNILAKYELVDERSVARQQQPHNVLASYYEDYAKSLRSMQNTIVVQDRHKRDKFWIQLANAIVALQSKRVSKDHLIKYINAKLGSRNHMRS